MGQVAGVGFLVQALGYGIPAALIVGAFLALPIITRHMRNKQDKDRREHMLKWESMVDVQRDAINKQKEIVDEIVHTHQMEVDRIISSHREETDRSYKLYERQASAIEALTHNLATITQVLQSKHFCPNNFTGDTNHGG
jgi:uncharacterized protein YicC (UPF0701 family)